MGRQTPHCTAFLVLSHLHETLRALKPLVHATVLTSNGVLVRLAEHPFLKRKLEEIVHQRVSSFGLFTEEGFTTTNNPLSIHGLVIRLTAKVDLKTQNPHMNIEYNSLKPSKHDPILLF